MIGEAAREGIVTASTRSITARIARMFSCSVLRINGVDCRMLMPSESETVRSTGMAVEKTNEVPLIHWRSTPICEPGQKSPDESRTLATALTSMGIFGRLCDILPVPRKSATSCSRSMWVTEAVHQALGALTAQVRTNSP